jgi:hypothetical protein
MMPFVTPEVVPTHVSVLMVFWKMLAVTEVVIPATVAVVLVEDKLLMVLELIDAVPPELEIPITEPPAPVEDNPVIELEVTPAITTLLLNNEIPVIELEVVIFEIVFELIEDEPKQYPT